MEAFWLFLIWLTLAIGDFSGHIGYEIRNLTEEISKLRKLLEKYDKRHY